MFFPITTALMAASVALAAPVTLAPRSSGTATIYNNCAFDISVNPCSAGTDAGTTTIPSNTTWTHDLIANGQGVSLKVASRESGASGVAQLEYTVDQAMAITFFDLSLINGNPFQAYDQQVVNENAGVFCAAGVANCKEAYMNPLDNWATHGTATGTNLDYYVCGGAPSTATSS